MLLSPHMLGTHVPIPAAMVVPGVASNPTIRLTTTTEIKRTNLKKEQITQLAMHNQHSCSGVRGHEFCEGRHHIYIYIYIYSTGCFSNRCASLPFPSQKSLRLDIKIVAIWAKIYSVAQTIENLALPITERAGLLQLCKRMKKLLHLDINIVAIWVKILLTDIEIINIAGNRRMALTITEKVC